MKLNPLIVEASIASLKVAVILWLIGSGVTVPPGYVDLAVGAPPLSSAGHATAYVLNRNIATHNDRLEVLLLAFICLAH